MASGQTRSSDRGFTIVGFILVTLTAMTAVAAVAAGVVISNKNKLNPNRFSISIVSTTAVRDPADLPVITVSYRLSFTSVAAVKARQTPVHVRCAAINAAGSASYADLDQSIEVRNVFEFGDIVLALGEQHRGVEGPVEVRCFLNASGVTLDGKSSTVVVPAPTSSGGGGGGTSDQVDGKYGLVFTRSHGSETDCVVDGEREITVTALTASTIKVSLADGDEFTSDLSGDLKYAGSLGLNPGFADYYGRMDGQFASTANGIQVGGLMRTERPACTFSFQGALR